jgi:hypothetical protein
MIPVHTTGDDTSMYRLVPAQYNVVQGGTRWYKQQYMVVHGGTLARLYENRLNRTGWYVLACWVCCPAAGFAAAILPGRQRCIGDYNI